VKSQNLKNNGADGNNADARRVRDQGTCVLRQFEQGHSNLSQERYGLSCMK